MGDNNQNDTEVQKENTEDIRAHTLYVIKESLGDTFIPKGETPESIYKVYNFDGSAMGTGVICIVGAFNYPTALDDFNTFSKQFGLPVETSTVVRAATNKVLQLVDARGITPPTDAGWAMESALDIQWAHAMAPLTKIVLLQAASNTFVDLFQAVDVANAFPNVLVVSMSWGGSEFSGETAFDVHLKQPGVTYVAGAGDVGGQTLYPSVSQYVLSVGGTKINRSKWGRFIGETAWADGGGGPSIFIPIPDYQAEMADVAAKTGAYRGTPDVAFDADPASGVVIYDSTPYNGHSGWVVIGGTSLATPCWAGALDSITYMSGIKLGGNAQKILYEAAGKTKYTNPCCCFRDIIFGKAGTFSATRGWDFITGLGTPNIKNLVRVLSNWR